MRVRDCRILLIVFLCSVHLCVTLVHTKPGVADRFIADFARCTQEIMKTPKAEVGGQVQFYVLLLLV